MQNYNYIITQCDTFCIVFYNKYMNREISKVDMAHELNISRPTLDKLIREHR